MTIREYARKCGVQIVGKLTRKPEFENRGERVYLDEIGNEFVRFLRGEFAGEILITTWDGGVI